MCAVWLVGASSIGGVARVVVKGGEMETAAARECARGELAATVEDELRRWQAAHPRATLTQITEAIDAALRPLRARYLADLVAEEEASVTVERTCTACGGQLQQRGRRGRAVLVPQDPVPLRLERAYLVCSSCGASVFPPRRGAGTAARQSESAGAGRVGAAG